MAFLDLLKSERGIMQLLFLAVLAALLFTHAGSDAISTWSQYAGGSVAVYTIAKSAKPGTPPTAPAPSQATPAAAPPLPLPLPPPKA